MGVGTLKDLALVQFVGVIAGTFSSIYFSAPLLVTLKSRQKKMVEHDRKVARARELAAERGTDGTDGVAGADGIDGGDAGDGSTGTSGTPQRTVTLPPRVRDNDTRPDGAAGSNDWDGGRTWRPGM